MSNSLQFIEDEIGRQRKSGTTKVWQPASCHHSIDIQHAGRVDIAAVCCTCMGDASFLSVVKGMGTSEMVVTWSGGWWGEQQIAKAWGNWPREGWKLPWKMLHYHNQKQDILGCHQHKNEQLGHVLGWCRQVEIRNPHRIWVLIQNPGAHYMSVDALYFYGHQWEQIVISSESRRQSTGEVDHLCQMCVLDGSGGWGDQPYRRLQIS